MNPDVAAAIPPLVEAGILPAAAAPRLLRVARGELVSVRAELRTILYLGVLLAMGGVGVLVEQNLDRIGPLAIAVGLGLAALAALGWVARTAPPFSWREAPSPHLGFDYLLLLGVLLAAADLAYMEVHFTPLGAHWAWHLLMVALLTALAAFRYDSRVVFSLSLSTFAAWRGVSVAHLGQGFLWGRVEDALRWNAIACGVLFVVIGLALAKRDRKAHFEPVAMHLGWLLVLLALGSGMDAEAWAAWTVALALTGFGLAVVTFLLRRFSLFAFGVLAAYAGVTRIVLSNEGGEDFGCFWFFFSSLVLIFGLVVAQRRMRGGR